MNYQSVTQMSSLGPISRVQFEELLVAYARTRMSEEQLAKWAEIISDIVKIRGLV
jgi:hypothetical protein